MAAQFTTPEDINFITKHGRGLEIDKLSAVAAEAHFNRYMARVCDRLGPLAGNVSSGLNAVLIDSHEVGCQNWTDGFEASFRQTWRMPEIWNAETGDIADAAAWRVEGGRTIVSLSLPPSGSAFVVFRRDTDLLGSAPVQAAETIAATTPEGPWHVSFPVDWYTGGETVKTREWPILHDWTSDHDPDIRFFSGTARYSATIPLATRRGGRVSLDLGDVKNFAVVTVNGRTFPPLWRPPFRVDVTDAVRPDDTELDLVIEITNLWPNRLIGDDFMEEDCNWRPGNGGDRRDGLWSIPDWVKRGEPSPTGRHTFTTWRHWTRDDAPLPSGLLGPVRLIITMPPENNPHVHWYPQSGTKSAFADFVPESPLYPEASCGMIPASSKQEKSHVFRA